jgi:uncharacterized membrane protein
VTRRAYIDWFRGLAVVVMMEWHVVDSWSVTAGRDSAAFSWAAFVGGWAAPMFLFLAGVSVALAGEAQVRRGQDLRGASWAVQKRGWQIFGIAHLFRLQSWITAGFSASWTSLFKPDILNILGLGLVGAAFAWGRTKGRVGRACWLLLPAAAILFLTPLSRVWTWPTALPVRLEAYIRPNRAGVFQIFPSAAFVFLGAWLGSIIAAPRNASAEPRFHLWLGAAGAALIGLGAVGSTWPPLVSTSDFWTTSLSLPVMRVGVMTLGLSLSWLWMQRPTAAHWSPFVLLGRTSLFVYWVHVELAYGLLSWPIHHAFPLAVTFAVLAVFIAGMTVLASWWVRWTPPPLLSLVPARVQSLPRLRP